ncbi:MAG: carbohydrate kinase family protein [Candidatus Kerfeldbacteria bacterium]|nr:carbohydrate kinase family protein [Candidatus Kerfeldbacteria bacterium]
MKKYDIVTVGSSLRDIMFYANTGVISQKEVWELHYGGKVMSDRVFLEYGGGASTAAVSCARLGLRVGIISSIGADEYGGEMRKHFRAEHVDTSMLYTSSHHTGFSFILVHQRTGEHVAFIHYGAAEECVLPQNFKTLNTEWFYVSSLNTTQWPKIMRTLIAHGGKIAWNPGNTQLRSSSHILKEMLASVHTLIVNEDESLLFARSLSEKKESLRQRIRLLHGAGPKVVVITRGRKGAMSFDGTTLYIMPKVDDRPVDTTGAGDSYGSAFVAGLHMYKGDIQRAMDLAALNSASNVAVVGAQRGLLYRSDLPRHLQPHI